MVLLKYKKNMLCLLINSFLWEYIYATVGGNSIKYIDIDDIDKNLDCIFEDLLPDYYFET